MDPLHGGHQLVTSCRWFRAGDLAVGAIQGVAMGANLHIACKHVCPAPPFAQGGDEGCRPPLGGGVGQ